VTGTKAPAIPNDTQWTEDDTLSGWTISRTLGRLSLNWTCLFLETRNKTALFRAITFTKDYNEIRFIHINILFFLHMNL
jgi:hypothetical protein